ncbi:MAG TPA: lipopolysaccharide biosynthesis protein, partial [Rhodothermales bacterium]|nr:lipopolysaccharide biosynthesis protein [Rhodothermales bacterium]
AFVFLNILFTYGLESAYLKYAAGDEGRARVHDVFSTATLSLLGTSLLLGGLFLLLPEMLALASGVTGEGGDAVLSGRIVAYVVAILVLDTLAVVPFAELRLEGRAWTFALTRVASILVNIGLNVWLIVGLGRGVEAVFEANVAASALTLLLLVPVYARLLRPRFDRGLWRELVAFGLPFVPGGLGYALTERASLFGLQALPSRVPGTTGTDQVGLFNATWKLGVFMMLVVQMFRFAWQPFFLQHAKDPDAKPLFARVFTLLAAGLWTLFLIISFFAYEIATLPLPGGRTLIGPAYLGGLVVVPLALAAYLFQGWYYAFSAGLYIEKQTKYFAHATAVGSVLAVVATVALVPSFGIVGAGWANVVGYAAMAAVLYRYAQRAYSIRFDWRKAGATSGLALGLFALWSFVPTLQRWYVEAGMLVLFGIGLRVLGVVPRGLLDRLRRRPARPLSAPDQPGESARAGAQLAVQAAEPSEMADEPGDPDASPPGRP